MKTSDAVRGRWAEVLRAFGLPAPDPRKHIDCPICGKSKKMRIDDQDGSGSWICVCGAGNGWNLLELVTGKDFKALASEIDQIIGNRPEYERSERPKNNLLDKALARFRAGSRIAGTEAETYLHSRNVYVMPEGGAAYITGAYNTDDKKTYSGIFALASNDFGEAVYSHLTFLDNGQKANVPSPRKMNTLQEYSGSVSIKLFPAQSTLGIAEGIETALSCHQLFKLPVWSAINATLLKRFRAPAGVNRLIIYADNDRNGTGLAAAFHCANRNLLSNNEVRHVTVRWPKKGDFNDMLTDPAEVFEWHLNA